MVRHYEERPEIEQDHRQRSNYYLTYCRMQSLPLYFSFLTGLAMVFALVADLLVTPVMLLP
jgi:uncharacterized membrane protein